MLEPGAEIGAYVVLREVGEGGMAWVYEVRGAESHQNPTFRNRRFALKLIKPEVATTEEFIRRFEQEAELQTSIDHPNLLTIFDYGRDEDSGLPFFTMNLVDGPNLAERIATEGPLDFETAGELFNAVLDALAHLHAQDPPIVHRDVKPSNIMLASAGSPYLGDLGVARRGDGSIQTRTRSLLGTVKYLSPEQARGREVDPRADIFSMGLTLYYALCGETVYDATPDVDADSEADILGYLGHLERVGEELDFPFPRGVPSQLQEIIVAATRIEPRARYQNAREMRKYFQTAIRRAQRELSSGALQVYATPSPLTLSDPAVVVRVPKDRKRRGSRRKKRKRARRRIQTLAGWVGGFAVIVAILAYSLSAGFWSSRRPDVRLALRELERLESLASDVVRRASRLEPPPDPGLISRVTRQLRSGSGYGLLSRQRLSEGETDRFLEDVARADEQFSALCRELAESDLNTRAHRAVREVAVRVEELRLNRAPTVVIEAWESLSATLLRLAPDRASGEACEIADAQLHRMEAVEKTRPIVEEMHAEMGEATTF